MSLPEILITPGPVATLARLALLLLVALLGGWIARRYLERVLGALALRTAWTWDDDLVNHGLARRLAWLVAPLAVQFGIHWVPGLPPEVELVVRNVAFALTTLFAILALGSLLDGFEANHRRRNAAGRSIKSYIQFAKLVLYVIAAILIVAILIDRSPLILLSGVGALSAVLMLVFKDTLLGLVAGVQLSSQDMLRVGDWIEMPGLPVDGDVIEVALHTVKVRNWDKTISTIPSWKLISEPFKNWRGMQESGGRRIKRALHIDASHVRFLSADEIRRLRGLRLLEEYLETKQSELASWNQALGEAGKAAPNQRRLTNLGTFRAYALAYLKAHPGIHQGMTVMVRQLAIEAEGVPLEIYAFTRSVVWAEYEGVQSDIFDHLIAILPEFGLALYQHPSGRDLGALADLRPGREAGPPG